MPGEAVVVIDVQDCFLPGGTLPTGNARNNASNPDKRAAANGLGIAIADFVNKKNPDHVFVSKDWHPEGHVSFASSHPGYKAFTETWDYAKSTNPNAYKGRKFPAVGEPGERFWGSAEARQGQLLWPAHCLQNGDARVAPEFLARLEQSQLSKVVNIVKGDDKDTDSYSVVASALGEFTPHVEGDASAIFRDILIGAELDTIYLTGIARNVCVFWSAMDILNYITVPQFVSTGKATKVVFMYNLTRPVAPGASDMSPTEVEAAVRDLLEKHTMKVTDVDAAYAALFEVRGDGSSYNAVGGNSKRKTCRQRASRTHKHGRNCNKKSRRNNRK
jgi:nicotinamidase-related amidase